MGLFLLLFSYHCSPSRRFLSMARDLAPSLEATQKSILPWTSSHLSDQKLIYRLNNIHCEKMCCLFFLCKDYENMEIWYIYEIFNWGGGGISVRVYVQLYICTHLWREDVYVFVSWYHTWAHTPTLQPTQKPNSLLADLHLWSGAHCEKTDHVKELPSRNKPVWRNHYRIIKIMLLLPMEIYCVSHNNIFTISDKVDKVCLNTEIQHPEFC